MRTALRAAAVAAGILAAGGTHPPAASANLATPGFRAVPVAQSAFPIAAVATAPDGRLFAAVQARGQTSGATPGTAEIRVYSAFTTNDGAVLDRGAVWATVEGVRATTIEEGLLGIALAPDFALSGLVYVYLTTTDGDLDQHVRVYRDAGNGTGVYLGTVATELEPPGGSSSRNGGGLAFGVDGCLYLGVGDNAGSNRWNAQVLSGTEALRSSERTAFCTSACLGTGEYPARTLDDGRLNHAGKVLRLNVEGPSTAQPATGPAVPAQPYVFGAGFGDPGAIAMHPLTGQVFVADRSENDEAEIGVADAGTNHGWPCLEGTKLGITSDVACLVGHAAAEVEANHPGWRRPLATHGGDPVIASATAYTGKGYPAEYYGDLFYLLRSSARIHRLDLEPPCFLPHPAGLASTPFHDTDEDGDFSAYYDLDGDGSFDEVGFTNLVALVQAPNPLGEQVLYAVGRQHNSSTLDADAVIFRLEYATRFTPYAGPEGRVNGSCFTDGPYSGGPVGGAPFHWENPFLRPTCMPAGGPCPGAADGVACNDGDACNGPEACQAGICRHGAPAADDTPCANPAACRDPGACAAGRCVLGGVVPDGTACPDVDPCNGLETCIGGTCAPGDGPAPLVVEKLVVSRGTTPGTDAVLIAGTVHPALAVAPHSNDDLVFELHDEVGLVYGGALTHPDSDPFWGRSEPPRRFVYRDPGGTTDGITAVDVTRTPAGRLDVRLKAKRLALPPPGPADSDLRPQLVLGDECFTFDLAGTTCRVKKQKLICTP
jgi:glucose/arabinose dehydrogenase